MKSPKRKSPKRKSVKRKSVKRKSVKRKSVKRKKSFSTTGIVLGSLSGLALIGIASKLLYDNYNIDKQEIINTYLEKLSEMDVHNVESFIRLNQNNKLQTTIEDDISNIINDKNGNEYKPSIVFIYLKKYYKTSGKIKDEDIDFINKTYNFIMKNLKFEFIDNYSISLQRT